jgi:hypothetical protein
MIGVRPYLQAGPDSKRALFGCCCTRLGASRPSRRLGLTSLLIRFPDFSAFAAKGGQGTLFAGRTIFSFFNSSRFAEPHSARTTGRPALGNGRGSMTAPLADFEFFRIDPQFAY